MSVNTQHRGFVVLMKGGAFCCSSENWLQNGQDYCCTKASLLLQSVAPWTTKWSHTRKRRMSYTWMIQANDGNLALSSPRMLGKTTRYHILFTLTWWKSLSPFFFKLTFPSPCTRKPRLISNLGCMWLVNSEKAKTYWCLVSCCECDLFAKLTWTRRAFYNNKERRAVTKVYSSRRISSILSSRYLGKRVSHQPTNPWSFPSVHSFHIEYGPRFACEGIGDMRFMGMRTVLLFNADSIPVLEEMTDKWGKW